MGLRLGALQSRRAVNRIVAAGFGLMTWTTALAATAAPTEDAVVDATPEPAAEPSEELVPAGTAHPGAAPTEVAPNEAAADQGFFDLGAADGAVPPMPEIEELPSRDPDPATQPTAAPPMPEVEQLPSREPSPTPLPSRRRVFDLGVAPDRAPAGTEGGSFFDPAKLDDTGPSGGALQIRGFVSANFLTSMRSNTRTRESDGRFERLPMSPFFDVNSATLYVGAPIYSDVVYTRIALEFLSIPTVLVNSSAQADIIPQANRQLFFESAAIEVNPLKWAERAPDAVRFGFKLTGGVFIVPFGIEDEEHASPVNWFISRPRAMTSNRVYPGTWTDVGLSLKWKPRFANAKNIRPIEIDTGFINGDPCSQTRFIDTLVRPGINVPCARPLREGELAGTQTSRVHADPRIDSGFFGIASDNNRNKSVFVRVQAFPVAALNFGGSFVYGKHPDGTRLPEIGKNTADLGQAPSFRAGGHIAVDFDAMFEARFPLPMLRGEVIYGEDHGVDPTLVSDRAVLGGYAQIAQPLFRRKKTRLPGLILQYRFDHADPDLTTPGVVNGVPVRSDFSDQFFADELLQSHTIGLRFPALPRFTLKGEYTFVLEDGGRENSLYNDIFGIQMVADF